MPGHSQLSADSAPGLARTLNRTHLHSHLATRPSNTDLKDLRWWLDLTGGRAPGPELRHVTRRQWASSPDTVRELLVDVHSSSSGAILQIDIHPHSHRLPNQRIHQAHPGIRQLGEPLGPASHAPLSQCTALRAAPAAKMARLLRGSRARALRQREHVFLKLRGDTSMDPAMRLRTDAGGCNSAGVLGSVL